MTILHQLWDFFASVRLAIFTLCALAITSIIGTIIPQGENIGFYAKMYGAKVAQFMQILDIPNMYYSWWFISLLVLLALNLTVCSLERFPRVWRIIQADNLNVSPERVVKMSLHHEKTFVSSTQGVDPVSLFKSVGMTVKKKQTDGGVLYFGQKGKYSRTGVYVVHLSILVIFAGAIVGAILGSKGSVMIPELKSTPRFFSADDKSSIDLGFEVRCDKFVIEFYDNGMPKEYQSTLTIIENGEEVLTRDIEVNGPLTYKGYTFYQSSYQPYQDFIISITNKENGDNYRTILGFQKQQVWDKYDVRFGVVNAEAARQRITRAKLWFKDGTTPASLTWLKDDKPTTISNGDAAYNIQLKQMYATGIQVAKDPGVWIVYLGCTLMLIGLYMAFFLSHRRIWMYHKTAGNKESVILGGSSNKNKIAFDQMFAKLVDQLEK